MPRTNGTSPRTNVNGNGKNVFLLAIAALLVFGAGYAVGTYVAQRSAQDVVTGSFADAETGERVSVAFDRTAQTATLTGLGHAGLVFAQGVSASGARYVNEAEDLVLWNKGDELSIFRGDERVFFGRTGGAAGDPRLAEHTWVWRETQMNNDDVIAPVRADAFTLRFDADERRVYGTTDCNGFSGTYAVGADNALSFGPFVSTEMYCEGSQEDVFVRMVTESSHTFFTEDGNLVLLLAYDSGSVLFDRR